MPLALMAIGSAVPPEKYEVIIVDGRLEKDPLKILLRHAGEALCLGITVLTGSPIRDALQVSRKVKENYPNLPVIWGGWHPSMFAREILKEEPAVDIAVNGQGEKTFAEIVAHLAAREDLGNVQGIAYRDQGEVAVNPPRPMFDMNELPPVNYDLIDVERYYDQKGRRQLDYISSTGCYFRCSFCADPFVFNRKWTAISPERMGEELELWYKRFHFTDLNFQDETFFTYPKRVNAIAEEILRRNLKFTWAATMRADQGSRMTEEDFGLCKRSGLRRVLIGVESGTQVMMDWLKKDIKIEQVWECAERCKRYDIGVIFPFIVGFPEETYASVRASLKMARKLRRHYPKFETPIFYFKPYPGSTITEDVVQKGFYLPQSLEEWADFDYIGSSGPWVSRKKYLLVENFKFYNRLSGGFRKWYHKPLQKLARWRCENNIYALPWERKLAETFIHDPQLS